MPNLTKWFVKASSGYANIVDAAEAGNLEAVKRLIAAGYDVNRRRAEDGNTALLAALTKLRFEIVSYLLTLEGVDFNIKNNAGNSVLLKAVEQGDNNLVSTLVSSHNVDVNQTNNHGISPLLLAGRKRFRRNSSTIASGSWYRC